MAAWFAVLGLSSLVAAFSPIIGLMLFVEHLRLRRERTEFEALLARYGR